MALRAPVDCEPLVGLPPDHAPLAVHDVALADDQVKVELPPLFTVFGEALSFTLAARPEPTVTVSDWVAVPPIPAHVNT